MAINNNQTDRYTLSDEMSRYVLDIVDPSRRSFNLGPLNPPLHFTTNPPVNPTQELPNIPPLVQTVPPYDQGVNTASITVTRPGPGPTITVPANQRASWGTATATTGTTTTTTTGTTTGNGGNGAFFSEPVYNFQRNEEIYGRMRRDVNFYMDEYMTSSTVGSRSEEPIRIGLGGLGGVDSVLAFLYKKEEILQRYYRESRAGSQDARQYSRELSELNALIKTVRGVKEELINRKGGKDFVTKIDSNLFIGMYFIVRGEEGTGKTEFVTILPYYQQTINAETRALEANQENTYKFNAVCDGLTRRHSSIVRLIGKQDFKITDSLDTINTSDGQLLLPCRRLVVNEDNNVKFFCTVKEYGGPISELKG